MAKSKKVKITINFDSDILEEVKKLAENTGAAYQSLLNKIVRDSLIKKKAEETRLDRLEKEIKALKKRLHDYLMVSLCSSSFRTIFLRWNSSGFIKEDRAYRILSPILVPRSLRM